MLVMHHHLYKAAGTTVDWVLQKNFPDRVLHVEAERQGRRLLVPEVLQRVASEVPTAVCMSSHGAPVPAAHEAWARVHLILLREPMARFYSMYRFAWSHPSASGQDAEYARRHSFSEYCEAWIERDGGRFTNWQTSCCTPQTEATIRDAYGWAKDLDTAMDVIENVVWVGTVERFDQTMVLLEDRLATLGQAFDAAYLRQNVGVGRSPSTDEERLRSLVGDAVYERFYEAHGLDVRLHRRATEQVDRRFEELADGAERLEDLRRRCAGLAETNVSGEVRIPGPDDWHRVAGTGEAAAS